MYCRSTPVEVKTGESCQSPRGDEQRRNQEPLPHVRGLLSGYQSANRPQPGIYPATDQGSEDQRPTMIGLEIAVANGCVAKQDRRNRGGQRPSEQEPGGNALSFRAG